MLNKIVPIVIPAYEPRRQLIELCKNLSDIGLKNIIIIDDGSGKKYREIFDEIEKKYTNCKVLRNAVNLGKGRALKNAFNYILNLENKEIIGCVTADCDGQHLVNDIYSCVKELEMNPKNLILGCRNFNKNNIPFRSKFGNKVTEKIFSYICGISISDTQTGLRGIPLFFMKKLMNVVGERFEFETNMLIISKENIQITEIKIETVYETKKNHQTHFKPLKDSVLIYKSFGKILWKYIFSSFSSWIIDIGIFILLYKFLKPIIPNLYIIVATIGARLAAASYNFSINYIYVFKSSMNIKKSLFKYSLLALVLMLISGMLVTFSVKMLNIKFEENAKIFIDILLMFASYFIQRKYIF